MNIKGPYTILGYSTPDTSQGCDAESMRETIREAREHARYMLSADYCRACEVSRKLARVIVNDANGECVVDLSN